ncbi:RIP metalloprotease RseP [Aquisediminimonas profunda]|uniref:RIP metalloprotease RseP n=1 Tax=Aquisediminimonas profunda TaxID=1550733 RepID=UPI001C625419|nr:RIP metalloprotease RseP [Aquisediminimonas profunda]
MTQGPGFIWTVLSFLIAIGPLIFLHELGHYLVARWCGVKADVFSIGFGREVVGWTDKRGTRWKVAWMPLGGYVRFAGDANAASQPDQEWMELPDFERSQVFHAKPVWQRAAITAAGPIVNFLVGFLLLAGLLATFGEMRIPSVVGNVVAGSVADTSGFRPGDRIVSIGDKRIEDFEELYETVYARPRVALDFGILRNGQSMHIVATPAYIETRDTFGNVQRRGSMGITPVAPSHVDIGWQDVPSAALDRTIGVVGSTIDGIGQIIFGNLSAKEMSGPVKMAKYAGQVATLGWVPFVGFVAMVSINLGFINLLPIPMLDGGHLLFYAIEGVIRRPVSPETQDWAFRTGFAVLMTLMLFVTFNDFASLELWHRLSGLIG